MLLPTGHRGDFVQNENPEVRKPCITQANDINVMNALNVLTILTL